MKFKLISLILILAGVVWLLLQVVVKQDISKNNLTAPGFSVDNQVKVSPSLSPSAEIFTFDKNTDLRQELDKVDPKITDQDFN